MFKLKGDKMKTEIVKFQTVDTNKLVGIKITDSNENIIFIDKEVAIVEGKTNEQYVQEAMTAAQTEIDEWTSAKAVEGKIWNYETNSFEDNV